MDFRKLTQIPFTKYYNIVIMVKEFKQGHFSYIYDPFNVYKRRKYV